MYFQCDLGYFSNIQVRDPYTNKNEDGRLMVTIRQAILDAFWIRNPGTVRVNLTIMKKSRITSKE